MKPAGGAWRDGESLNRGGAATVIGRGFSLRLGAQALSALINVAGMVLLGGYLAADGYGQYAFYYALVPLVASLSAARTVSPSKDTVPSESRGNSTWRYSRRCRTGRSNE